MDEETLIKHVQGIVKEACEIKDRHTEEIKAPVNYACIFSQSKGEYQQLLAATQSIGVVIKETSTGHVFHIRPLQTVAGKLHLLKIRLPDRTRPEKGDADFTIKDFPVFRDNCLKKKGFKLIERPGFEMVELRDAASKVLVYFSNPPLWNQMGMK